MSANKKRLNDILRPFLGKKVEYTLLETKGNRTDMIEVEGVLRIDNYSHYYVHQKPNFDNNYKEKKVKIKPESKGSKLFCEGKRLDL